MNKLDLEMLQELAEKDLIKSDSVFVLDSGRLIFCNPEMADRSDPTVVSVRNPIRVGAISGNIEINYKRFKQFDKKFRLWLLFYAYNRFLVNSDSSADLFASNKYVEKYGMKGLFTNWIQMVKHAPTEHNRERLKTLQALIKNK